MNTVRCQQTHSKNVHTVKSSDFNKTILNCDGLVTNIKGVTLVISTADCVPLSLKDSKNNVIALIHAGWKGVKKGIVINAVSKMVVNFKSNPKDIETKIGPSIDKDNFIVRSDVYNLFKNKYLIFFEKISDNQWKMDLKGIVKEQLIETGIVKKNIHVSKISTYKNKNYPSYRRDGKSKGFETKIVLK